MAEQTRLWRGGDNSCDLEFDYLAIMKSWPGCEDFLLGHSIHKMEVKYKIVDPQSKECVYVNLNPQVKLVFASNLHTCINEKCRQNSCALSLRTICAMLGVFELSGCHFCSVRMKTGELKCTQTSLRDGRLDSLHRLDRLRFLWTSKNRSLSIPSASIGNHDIFEQVECNLQCNLDYTSNGKYNDMFEYTLPELTELTEQPEEVSIEVDFHPVLEIVDIDVVQWLVRCFVDDRYIHSQNIYTYSLKNRISAVKAHQHCLNRPSKILRLAYFTLKILAISNQWKFRKTPLLEKKGKYFLFPKGRDLKSWSVSTCQSELEILKKTSKEHRLAFCFLKFLVNKIKKFKDTFLYINQYEAKIAVINHISDCKSPTIGAHICTLNIVNDIVRCRSVKSMNHPFLQFNWYDFDRYEPKWLFIHFKVLLFLLVNQTGKYTVGDLYNDLISIQLVSFTLRSFASKYRIPVYDYTRDLVCELREICKRRKMTTAYRMINVIASLHRKVRLRKLQFLLLQENINASKEAY